MSEWHVRNIYIHWIDFNFRLLLYDSALYPFEKTLYKSNYYYYTSGISRTPPPPPLPLPQVEGPVDFNCRLPYETILDQNIPEDCGMFPAA